MTSRPRQQRRTTRRAPTMEAIEPRRMCSAVRTAAGTLTITGTAGGDVIRLSARTDGGLNLSDNGVAHVYGPGRVRRVRVTTGDGDDRVLLDNTVAVPATVNAGGGSDSVVGGRASDVLDAGDGDDTVRGNSGNDRLFAGGGRDAVFGNAGGDVLIDVGNAGDLRGGGGFDIDLIFEDGSVRGPAKSRCAAAAARWTRVITGDVPDVGRVGRAGYVDDLRVAVYAAAVDGVGDTLAQSDVDQLRPVTHRYGSLLPYAAYVELDAADLADPDSRPREQLDTITHELGHALGFGTIWTDVGLVTGEGGRNPRFTGRQATRAYNALYGYHGASVPLENNGGEGSDGSHWRESVFGDELMTGFADDDESLSRLTVASMADLGYQVDLTAAEPWTPVTDG